MFLYSGTNFLSEKDTGRVEKEKDFFFIFCNNSLLCLRMDHTNLKVLFEKTNKQKIKTNRTMRKISAPMWVKRKICFISLSFSQASVYLYFFFLLPYYVFQMIKIHFLLSSSFFFFLIEILSILYLKNFQILASWIPFNLINWYFRLKIIFFLNCNCLLPQDKSPNQKHIDNHIYLDFYQY